MRLYSAGSWIKEPATAAVAGLRYVLLSYATMTGDRLAAHVASWGAVPGARVFMDSGAFSAKNKGVVVDLVDYCGFLDAHRGRLSDYAALDVIGDAEASLVNWRRMREAGLDPIAAHHYGTPAARLEELMAERPTALALGGMVLGRWRAGAFEMRQERQGWLDQTWRVLERHWPIRVHLFGTLTQWILERYPFYSADSTSALLGAAFGNINEFRLGRYVMDRECNWHLRRLQTPCPGGADVATGEADARMLRLEANIRALAGYERYLTDLWAARGVAWGDR